MSKGGFTGKPDVQRTPAEQLRFFADLYRLHINASSVERLRQKTRELGLNFLEDELIIIAGLDTPAKVQEFLNTQIYYNWDHSIANVEETSMSPRQVLQTATAHCFEGALFAYAVNFLHGHEPAFVLLEASQDSEHNLVIVRDPKTGLYGANAHSAFPNLDGRAAQFHTIRELSETYYPYYYSDRTFDAQQLTLVGYSEPFDLIRKFGVKWISSEEPLWDLYYTYVDDSVRFHYLFDDSNRSHLYPLLNSLKEGWIQINTERKTSVHTEKFSSEMLRLWTEFWREHIPPDSVPQGKAKELEQQFMKTSGTTPIDLMENAEELEAFLDRGYNVNRIISL